MSIETRELGVGDILNQKPLSTIAPSRAESENQRNSHYFFKFDATQGMVIKHKRLSRLATLLHMHLKIMLIDTVYMFTRVVHFQ